MARILACCANGSGTSLMMKLTLDKVISTCGFKVEEARHDSIMEGRKVAADYDIVLCPMNFVDMFADAAAMAQREMTEALMNCGIDLKA